MFSLFMRHFLDENCKHSELEDEMTCFTEDDSLLMKKSFIDSIDE